MSKRKEIALITGASSGIGNAISLNLCKKGYHCILASRSKEKLEKLSESLNADGYSSTALMVDVSDKFSVDCFFTPLA